LRSAFSALAFALVACGGASTGGGATAQPVSVPFTEVAITAMSDNSGQAAILVTADASAVRRVVDRATAPAGRTFVVAMQGEQRTGGYAIRITSIERQGTTLLVRATFTTPPPGAVVTQVITSPAHVVSVASTEISGVTSAVLVDQNGTERARIDVR